MMTKVYRVEILKVTEKDHYVDGCDYHTSRDHGVVFSFKSADLELVKSRIKTNLGLDLSDAEEFEGRLETSRTEDVNGEIPSKHVLRLWQENDSDISLYNATYSIYLSEVVETELNAIILK